MSCDIDKSIITAVAVVVALVGFLIRKQKFNRHITRKGTSYAKDALVQQEKDKIVAKKAAKVDNVVDVETGD